MAARGSASIGIVFFFARHRAHRAAAAFLAFATRWSRESFEFVTFAPILPPFLPSTTAWRFLGTRELFDIRGTPPGVMHRDRSRILHARPLVHQTDRTTTGCIDLARARV